MSEGRTLKTVKSNATYGKREQKKADRPPSAKGQSDTTEVPSRGDKQIRAKQSRERSPRPKDKEKNREDVITIDLTNPSNPPELFVYNGFQFQLGKNEEDLKSGQVQQPTRQHGDFEKNTKKKNSSSTEISLDKKNAKKQQPAHYELPLQKTATKPMNLISENTVKSQTANSNVNVRSTTANTNIQTKLSKSEPEAFHTNTSGIVNMIHQLEDEIYVIDQEMKKEQAALDAHQSALHILKSKRNEIQKRISESTTWIETASDNLKNFQQNYTSLFSDLGKLKTPALPDIVQKN